MKWYFIDIHEWIPIAIEQTERKEVKKKISNNNNAERKNDVLLETEQGKSPHKFCWDLRWVCGNHVSFRYAPHILCAMHITTCATLFFSSFIVRCIVKHEMNCFFFFCAARLFVMFYDGARRYINQNFKSTKEMEMEVGTKCTHHPSKKTRSYKFNKSMWAQ